GIHNTTALTPAQMRDGMENLEITEAKMTELGLPGFGPSFKVSCQNHGGDGLVAVVQWDYASKSWNMISDFQQSDQDILNPLIAEDSAAYAAEANITPGCN
ncbi:MAG: ABC transporter permease, partial [Paracoccaceae bacterium]|nr:ABC transporter permease [Paracoccaceae bacterium]